MEVRNVYFRNGIFTEGHGNEIVYFSGHLYSNVGGKPNGYEEGKDLYIDCTKCSRKRFKSLIKK